MFVFGLVVGLALGAVVVGVLANRRPQWFAHVVTLANSVDDKVNSAASAAVAQAAKKL